MQSGTGKTPAMDSITSTLQGMKMIVADKRCPRAAYGDMTPGGILSGALGVRSPANGTVMAFADEADSFLSGFGITPDDKVSRTGGAYLLICGHLHRIMIISSLSAK